MSNSAPKVFISYSHDSEDHKNWVLSLAKRLREDGVDAIIDRWDLKPGKDVPLFMEEQLGICDFALLICSDRYVTKANAGEGGVGYERMIVSSELTKSINHGKFIPVIINNRHKNTPTFIKTKLYLDFTNSDFFETQYDALLRTIFNTEISTKPPLGKKPAFDHIDVSKDSTPARMRTGLGVEEFELFEVIVKHYDEYGNFEWSTEPMSNMTGFGRITVEAAAIKLNKLGLLDVDYHPLEGKTYTISAKGIVFAQENRIVS
jgi:hypothetical protein